MERHTHNTSRIPAPIGPYSHGVFVQGKLFFMSGQIGMKTDGCMAGDDIEAQTRQTLLNIFALLDSAGMSAANIVKTTIFLKDLNDFSAVNDVYSDMVGSEPPARSTVQVARLPKDALVEIEAIAVAGV
jgi:2-iminobutanoate/2-iminopropanoate deaminase